MPAMDALLLGNFEVQCFEKGVLALCSLADSVVLVTV